MQNCTFIFVYTGRTKQTCSLNIIHYFKFNNSFLVAHLFDIGEVQRERYISLLLQQLSTRRNKTKNTRYDLQFL